MSAGDVGDLAHGFRQFRPRGVIVDQSAHPFALHRQHFAVDLEANHGGGHVAENALVIVEGVAFTDDEPVAAGGVLRIRPHSAAKAGFCGENRTAATSAVASDSDCPPPESTMLARPPSAV